MNCKYLKVDLQSKGIRVLKIKESGLSWKRSKAGCVKCRACSALDVFSF